MNIHIVERIAAHSAEIQLAALKVTGLVGKRAMPLWVSEDLAMISVHYQDAFNVQVKLFEESIDSEVHMTLARPDGATVCLAYCVGGGRFTDVFRWRAEAGNGLLSLWKGSKKGTCGRQHRHRELRRDGVGTLRNDKGSMKREELAEKLAIIDALFCQDGDRIERTKAIAKADAARKRETLKAQQELDEYAENLGFPMEDDGSILITGKYGPFRLRAIGVNTVAVTGKYGTVFIGPFNRAADLFELITN